MNTLSLRQRIQSVPKNSVELIGNIDFNVYWQFRGIQVHPNYTRYSNGSAPLMENIDHKTAFTKSLQATLFSSPNDFILRPFCMRLCKFIGKIFGMFVFGIYSKCSKTCSRQSHKSINFDAFIHEFG